MELLGGPSEPDRIAADLVQCREPVPAVVRGVLDALRHDHAAGLLKADRQFAIGDEQPIAQECHRLCEIWP